MKKLLFLALVPLILGPAGFVAGRFLIPAPDPSESMAATDSAPREILYKMPLGKFVIQVLQPGKILHILIDMDVYISGATTFERMNGAKGRAILRDATITAVSDLAETALWIDEGAESQLDKDLVAEQIVRKLQTSFVAVQAAQIKEFMPYRSPRH